MRKKHILSQNLIFRIAHELKKCGKVIGLTHGAFDLFHSSHLDLLIKSSELCDFLIVGVDSDQSIKEYKSDVGPIINQRSRLKIINELNCVDATFIKNVEFLPSDMLQMLYKEIRPDIVTIGRNYAIEDRIRSDVEKANSKLIQIDTYQNYTTTKIINRVIELHRIEKKED